MDEFSAAEQADEQEWAAAESRLTLCIHGLSGTCQGPRHYEA